MDRKQLVSKKGCRTKSNYLQRSMCDGHFYLIKWSEKGQEHRVNVYHIRNAIKFIEKLTKKNLAYTLIHKP